MDDLSNLYLNINPNPDVKLPLYDVINPAQAAVNSMPLTSTAGDDLASRNATYQARLAQIGSIPGTTSLGDVYSGFTGTPAQGSQPAQSGGVGKGISALLNYFASPEGKQVMAGIVSNKNPYMGEALNQQAAAQKQQGMTVVQAIQAQNMEKLKLQGQGLDEQNKAAAEASRSNATLNLEKAKFSEEQNQHKTQNINEGKKLDIEQQNSIREQKAQTMAQQKAEQDRVNSVISSYKNMDADTAQQVRQYETSGTPYVISTSVGGHFVTAKELTKKDLDSSPVGAIITKKGVSYTKISTGWIPQIPNPVQTPVITGI